MISIRAISAKRTGDEEADGKHYLKVGRIATVFGVLLSIASAYIASKFGNIMDFLQTIFSMINAPLFAVIFLGDVLEDGRPVMQHLPDLLLGFLMALASSWPYNTCRSNNPCKRRMDSDASYLSC